MDRTFATPRDAGNAAPEDVLRVLGRVLRTVQGSSNFIYQEDFEFSRGRRAPLLMIGSLRGGWREYVRRNASRPGFAAGSCLVRREEGGKVLLDLNAEHGRGSGAGFARTINAELLRRMNAEARFVTPGEKGKAAAPPGPAAAPAVAAAAPAGARADAASPGTGPAPDPARLAAGLKTILEGFAAFKAKPSEERLEALTRAIAAWRALRERSGTLAGDAKEVRHVEKIATLLAEKGRAYVARAKSAGGA